MLLLALLAWLARPYLPPSTGLEARRVTVRSSPRRPPAVEAKARSYTRTGQENWIELAASD